MRQRMTNGRTQLFTRQRAHPENFDPVSFETGLLFLRLFFRRAVAHAILLRNGLNPACVEFTESCRILTDCGERRAVARSPR